MSFKKTLTDNAHKLAAGTLGAIHFASHSISELALEAEARITKGDHEDTKNARMIKTINRQDAVLNRVAMAKAKLNNITPKRKA